MSTDGGGTVGAGEAKGEGAAAGKGSVRSRIEHMREALLGEIAAVELQEGRVRDSGRRIRAAAAAMHDKLAARLRGGKETPEEHRRLSHERAYLDRVIALEDRRGER